MHELMRQFAHEFVDEFFANFVHELSTKFVRIRTNSYEIFARKIGYVTNGLYCILARCFLTHALVSVIMNIGEIKNE